MGHIQIRNVPDDLHRKLKARAAAKGMTLSDYLLAEVRELAETPTMEEIVARVRARPLFELDGRPDRHRPARARREVIVLDASAAIDS